MIFTKDTAHIAFNLKDGSTITETYTLFYLDVEKFSKNLMRDINNDKAFMLDSGEIIHGEEVDYFEIINYDKLLELKLERERETEEE